MQRMERSERGLGEYAGDSGVAMGLWKDAERDSVLELSGGKVLNILMAYVLWNGYFLQPTLG